MVSPIFTPPTTNLKQTFAEIQTEMHSYCSNNAVTLLNAAKSIKNRSIMNFKILKFTCISSISQPASQPTCQPACRKTRFR